MHSGSALEERFQSAVKEAPSPLTVSQFVFFFLAACGESLQDFFYPAPTASPSPTFAKPAS